MGRTYSVCYYVAMLLLSIACSSMILLMVMNNHLALSKPDIKQQSFHGMFGTHWIHSHEEDKGDVKVFRPSTFNFPLSRLRDGFEILENGTFIKYDIGKADTLDTTVHSYSMGTNGLNTTLTVGLDNNNNMCMEINPNNNDKLNARQWFVPKSGECNVARSNIG